MARILLNNAGPSLIIPFTSNHPFACQGSFNKARIMLDIANLSLTIPSTTRNHHFYFYGAIIVMVVAGLSFTIESIWNHLFNGFVRCCCPSSDYSIHQESSLSCVWRQLQVITETLKENKWVILYTNICYFLWVFQIKSIIFVLQPAQLHEN